MNNSLIAYIEKDLFDKVDNVIMQQRFHNVKSQKGQLWCKKLIVQSI